MKSSDIQKIPSNRIMVKKLPLPQLKGNILIPAHCLEQKNRKAIWYAEVVKFGLDTNADLAFDLKPGDIIGIDPIELSADTTKMEDGEFVFIEQDNISVKDDGSIRALYPELYPQATTLEVAHA